MKKVSFVLILSLALAPVAFAKSGKTKKQSIKPAIVDPDDTGAVVAAWLTHGGLPDSGKSYHTLLLQKDGASATNAYAYAKVKWLDGKTAAELTQLGFDYKNGGHCTLTSPRFVLTVDGVEYSFGCAAGVATAAPGDPLNWTRVTFDLTAAGIPSTGIIQGLKLVFDEGTDAGVGYIYLDNININGTYIGKSGKGNQN